jgi:tetratricopeptide (TPR) repeat protein
VSDRQQITSSGTAAASPAEVGRPLAADPKAAEARAREALKAQPQSTDALLMLASALRKQGKAEEARSILERVVASEPDSAFAQLELGLALGLLGRPRAAIESLALAVDLSPTYLDAWCAIAEALWGAEAHSSAGDPCRPESALAAIRSRRFSEAEMLLGDFLEREPDCQPARLLYAVTMLAQEKAHLAIVLIDELIRRDPTNPLYGELRASALFETGEIHGAIAQYEEILHDRRKRPGAWLSYGRALGVIGREQESLGAIRKAVEILPGLAAGYRSLGMVKSAPLDSATINALHGLLARPGQLVVRRAQLHFALAKALEDSGSFAESFENYQRSNELQAAGVSGTVDRFLNLVRRTKALFTPAFLRARAGLGCESKGPIFVLGMLRSGSTLLQEILAAHSAVERTGELRILNNMALQLRAGVPENPYASRYPEVLDFLDASRFSQLGEEYIERTRPRRKSGLPFFIDKLPENFIYAGLIHLILPNARIIDMRRHPLDCCLSCFTNYFPEGPRWTHKLDDLGRYYAGYVELMAHFDELMPGLVHRIIYEQLVEDPEKEVRRLLEHLGLPFEDKCLRFYENEQAIVTASAGQARKPVYRGGVGSSRKFDPWLAPLKRALGQVLDDYPEVPKFYPALRASFSSRLA